MLDAMAAQDPARSVVAAARGIRSWPRRAGGGRTGWPSPDLGITPVEPEVAGDTRDGRRALAGPASSSRRRIPISRGRRGLSACCARSTSPGQGGVLRRHRDRLKPEVIWNIERAQADGRATARRSPAGRDDGRTSSSSTSYDLLLAPATIMAPFPIEQPLGRRVQRPRVRQLRRMAGHRLCGHAGVLPRAVAPCGFTAQGGRSACRSSGRRAARRAAGAAKALEDILGVAQLDADRSAVAAIAGRAATAGPTHVEQTGRDGVLLQPPICGNCARARGRAEPNVKIPIVRGIPR